MLGQFDPFYAPDGRLLLVAPNIVHVERELEADPSDFRLWVCLHEETHRVQFTAVPWMRDHMFAEIAKLADTMEPSSLLEDGLGRMVDAVKSGTRGASLLDVVSTPEQKELIDRLTGVMSLLEGHADVVMDGVGPTRDPERGEDPDEVQQAPQGRRRARQGAAPAARAGRQDGAVPRRRQVRPRGRRQGRDGRVQRRLGAARAPAHQGRDRRPRRLDVARPGAVSDADEPAPGGRRGPGRRYAACSPRPRGRAPSGATVLVACSGGADSLALLAATVFEGHKLDLRVIGVTVDHGLQEGSAEHAAEVVSQMAGLGADETASATVTVEAGGRGVEAAAREARYAVLDQMADHFGAGAGAARAHPGRPGRDRAARAGPRLRRPVAGRHATRSSTATAARCST